MVIVIPLEHGDSAQRQQVLRGGVSITGGRGSVFGVLLGAVLLRLVSDALVRFGISMDQTQLFVGAVLLIAVSIDLAWRGRQTSG